MGDRALRCFDDAGKIAGLTGRMKLASLARLTSTEAGSIEDTPEVLKRLDDALVQLRAEYGRNPESAQLSKDGTIAIIQSGTPEAKMLRSQLQTFGELMGQRRLFLGDVNATVRRINEAAAQALGVERVSVWFLDEGRTKISCVDLFVRSTRQHSSGIELFAKDFAPYFKALESERTIPAGDAHRDPRTSCFSQSYLTPLGINSMLDVPIWLGEKMAGVICHEHVGPKRSWNSDEETFAYLMASFVSLALERGSKR